MNIYRIMLFALAIVSFGAFAMEKELSAVGMESSDYNVGDKRPSDFNPFTQDSREEKRAKPSLSKGISLSPQLPRKRGAQTTSGWDGKKLRRTHSSPNLSRDVKRHQEYPPASGRPEKTNQIIGAERDQGLPVFEPLHKKAKTENAAAILLEANKKALQSRAKKLKQELSDIANGQAPGAMFVAGKLYAQLNPKRVKNPLGIKCILYGQDELAVKRLRKEINALQGKVLNTKGKPFNFKRFFNRQYKKYLSAPPLPDISESSEESAGSYEESEDSQYGAYPPALPQLVPAQPCNPQESQPKTQAIDISYVKKYFR